MKVLEDRDEVSPSSESTEQRKQESSRMSRPQVHTTKYGTQFVDVVDLIESEAGWAEIERILDADLVQKPTQPNGSDDPSRRSAA